MILRDVPHYTVAQDNKAAMNILLHAQDYDCINEVY